MKMSCPTVCEVADLTNPSSAFQEQSTIQTVDPEEHLPKRICLVGSLQIDQEALEAAKKFNLPIVLSEDGLQYMSCDEFATYFILSDFDSELFTTLDENDCRVIGKPAFMDMAEKGILTYRSRPLYSNTMENCIVVFTGFRKESEVRRLFRLIHHMGGSIRKQLSDKSVTHLLAHTCMGEKYQYAVTFDLPVMSADWVDAAWAHRDERKVKAEDEALTRYKARLFHNIHVATCGFSEDDSMKIKDLIEQGGGKYVSLDNSNATHIVLDEVSIVEKPNYAAEKAFVVRSEWFWSSIQINACANEKLYLFESTANTFLSPRNKVYMSGGTPGSKSRRRKRVRETVQQLAENESPSSMPASKRRSSVNDLAFIMSNDGSFLDDSIQSSPRVDKTPLSPPVLDLRQITPRQRVFQELCMTECNYVSILDTIQTVIKEPLEDPNQPGGTMLDTQDLRYIFGNLPPIHEVHKKIRKDLLHLAHHWTDECPIGKTILQYTSELEKAYPPFVNYFENVKELLQKQTSENPRFHAFLKIAQSRPECGRQSLAELLIRPVQRLPSMSLLLGDLVKHTDKSNSDLHDLKSALESIKSIMTLINDDKRKTEAKLKLFEIHNDIENCPPNLVASHRTYFEKVEVVVDENSSIATRGDTLCLFLFNDMLEICKKKGKFNSLKSPSRANVHVRFKNYKHLEMVPLLHIKRVLDLRVNGVCRNSIALIVRSNQETDERLYAFTILPNEIEKQQFIKLLCGNIASSFCRSDVENFYVVAESEMLDITTREVLQNNGISRAMRFATRTGRKVSRALSFNKSPGKLKRAVSTVMSPFTNGSHQALRGATSVTNINASMNPPATPTSNGAMAAPSTPTIHRKLPNRRIT